MNKDCRQIKVLFAHSNATNIGGQEKALLNTIVGLGKNGIVPIVLLPEKGRFSNLLESNRIQVVIFKLSMLSKTKPFQYIKTVINIYCLLKREKIKLVHCSGAYPTQYCLPAAKLLRIPCVTHIHSTIYSEWDIKRSYVPKADYVIAVSDTIRKILLKYGCSPLKTKTVYCGVIDQEICFEKEEVNEIKKKYDIPSNYKLVGQISIISPLKGLEYFIEMSSRIKQTYPDVKFIIIGNTANGYEKELKSLVSKLDLDKDIIFTGFQSEVNKFISALDIVVLSSLIEGLPFSIVESLASGKPVVATSVGGTPEVIIDNQTGMLVPPKNSEALAEKVIKLLNHPDEARKFGQNGRQFVLERFDINNHAKNMLGIYNEILNKKKAKKILFYEPSTGYGGSARCLFDWLNNFNMKEFNPLVATHFNGPGIQKIKNTGAQVIRLPYVKLLKILSLRCKEGTLVSYLIFMLEIFCNILPISIYLVILIISKKIEMVTINANIIYGLPAIIAAKIVGVPCVCHIHETRKLNKKEKLFAGWVKKFIVLTNQALKLYAADIATNKITVVYNGLNFQEFLLSTDTKTIRKELNLYMHESVIGIVGRIAKGKGHEDFIRAAQKIRSVNPNVKFLIIGSSVLIDQGLETRLKNLVSELGLSENIIFTGWRDNVKEIISVLDILVFPSSTFPEGFPLTCIEGMALRKPIVATNIPGPSEIVVDGITGYLIPPLRPDILAEKIINLLNSPLVATKMGKAGRIRAEEFFDIRKNSSQIENIYLEALNQYQRKEYQNV